MPPFALPGATYAFLSRQTQTAASNVQKITLLEDGGFGGDAWGWQFTQGAKVLRNAGRNAEAGAVYVATRSGDYARFLVLSPEAGRPTCSPAG